jgi:catechol 2,3-dioxygenase-like lactoylglutathione lyase family enzyme
VPLAALDHVNIRTAGLEVMCAFYCDVLGLVRGPRPPFSFGGAWLYCAGRPVVHLVEVATPPAPPEGAALALSHFAFSATGMADLVARLRAAAISHRLNVVPGYGTNQVAMRDPDGNDLHVDFPADERPG